MSQHYYRFRFTFGFLRHVWKSAMMQDHAALRQTIGRYLPGDGVAIDVGAHGGQFTRLLAGIACKGQVIAIEPSSYARSILRMALWVRWCRNVIVMATALGSESGVAVIHTPFKRRGDMGYGLANLVGGYSDSMAEPVAVLTLDSVVERLKLERVDFIKADIEGYEAEFIAGSQETIKKFRPALLLEMDDGFLRRAGSSVVSLWSELAGLGYLPYTVEGFEPLKTIPQQSHFDVLWVPQQP